MFTFFRKAKMSCQELAETLAPRFTKLTVKMFEEQKETLGEDSWAIASDGKKCRTDPLKEWALFNLAGYINGCRSSMKQDATHFELVRCFITACGRDFIKRGVFSTETEFEQFSMDRVADYLSALQEGDAEEKMQRVGQKFLRNVGCNSDNIIYRIGAVGSFTSTSIATKTMFDDILKKIRLVN